MGGDLTIAIEANSPLSSNNRKQSKENRRFASEDNRKDTRADGHTQRI